MLICNDTLSDKIRSYISGRFGSEIIGPVDQPPFPSPIIFQMFRLIVIQKAVPVEQLYRHISPNQG